MKKRRGIRKEVQAAVLALALTCARLAGAYTQPPTVKRALATNLCAMIAPIRYCRLHPVGHPGCASREQQVAMTDGWAAVASRLGYYNYMYNLADGTLPMFKVGRAHV